MEYIADYRDALKARDELHTMRQQRNTLAWLAAAGWCLLLIVSLLWIMH